MDTDRERERAVVDERLAEARRSLADRLDLLSDRMERARDALALGPRIREHLGLSLGAAAVLGAALGLRGGPRGPRASPPAGPGPLGSILEAVARSAATAIAATVVTAVIRGVSGDGVANEGRKSWER